MLDLGDESFEHRVIAEASEASALDPTVADPSGVATEATTVDTSEISPPPTSPNLVEPGVEPVQVGHTPSAPSRPPRTRQRSSRGGQVTRWQEANREWWKDFERVVQWLYQNSGGRVVGGFHLKRISYQQASEEIAWFVANFQALIENYSTSNCLALAYYIFESYCDWAHQFGLDKRRGPSHGRQVIEAKDLPPKRIINRTILGSEYPSRESWDRYYRYVGPQQQPLPKREAAAPAPAGGAAAFVPPTAKVVEAAPKVPTQPDHPPPEVAEPKAEAKEWQPSLRSIRPAEPAVGPKVVTTSVPVPKPPKTFVYGGVAVPPARDILPAPVAPSPASQPVVVKAKVPNVNLSRLPPPPTSPPPNIPTSSSSAGVEPLRPPPFPPPKIPPPPQHPPPTAQELVAAATTSIPKAAEGAPGDPNDPPPPEEEEGDWVEEGEEEEVEEEDEVVEAEEEEPEFPDFPSPRDRHPKRDRSDPPVPVRLVTREARERLEISSGILRARTELGLGARPNILRPQVPGFPQTRTDPSGTWLRVAGPPVANLIAYTAPYIVPGDAAVPFDGIDPHQLPDSFWRDPSLRGQETLIGTPNLDPSQVVNVAINDPATESEGEEPPERAHERITASGRHFIEAAAAAPVEAEFVERVPKAPTAPPPKRQRTGIRITQVSREAVSKPAPKAAETPAKPKATVVPPWRAAAPEPKASEPVATAEVAEGRPSVATASRSRTRTRAQSAQAAPRAPPENPPPTRGRATNKIVSPKPAAPKRATTVPVPLRSRPAAAPAPAAPAVPKGDTPPTGKTKSGLPYKSPPSRIREPDQTVPPVELPPSGAKVIPPRPGRPVPVLPAPKSVKAPPPGYSSPSGAKHRSPATSPNPPPISPEQETAEHPLAGEEASGPGLAPHRPGRPLPSPTPVSDEPSGNRPKHHGPPLAEPPDPRLVSRVVHVDTRNIVICVDWHDTLDQALNAVGELNQRVVDRFRAVCRIAKNRVEFHIVSYAGESRIEGTRAGATHLIDFLNRNGIPFRDLHLVRHPCGREGKASTVAALQAHCLVDDRGDVLNETALTGAKTIRSEGHRDRELHWLAAVEDWIRQETVDGILYNRRAIPLRPQQYKDRWGDKREAHNF